MEELMKIRKLYELKKIERSNSVADRKESSAEHTWSCLVLADYLMSRINQKLNPLKVYELLLYHDIVEIESGDTPIERVEERYHKHDAERKALEKLLFHLPDEQSKKIVSLFKEFEANTTPEAKFARAVDRLDAIIHELDYKKDWKEWNEKMLREFNKESYKAFPELQKLFEQLLRYMKKEGYIK